MRRARPRPRPRRSIFVTVGTTSFDALVAAASHPAFLARVSGPDCGAYSALTVQYGRGSVVPSFAAAEKAPSGENDGSASTRKRRQPKHGGQGKNGIMQCAAYRFKPSIRQDMADADLIVSHAGAGSIMEGMELCASSAPTSTWNEGQLQQRNDGGGGARRKKKLVVVTNAALMHGHQSELAEALGARGHLFVVRDPQELLREETLRRIEAFDPVPFTGGDGGRDFAALVDHHFGF